MAKAPRHPGRTPTQRRVLDEMGHGSLVPRMTSKTRKALLATKQIVQIADGVVGNDEYGPVVRHRYVMSAKTKRAWLDALGHEPDPALDPVLVLTRGD